MVLALRNAVPWPVSLVPVAMELLALKSKRMKLMKMVINWRNGNVNVQPVIWVPRVRYRCVKIIPVNMEEHVYNFQAAVIYVCVHWANMVIIVNTVSLRAKRTKETKNPKETHVHL